MSRDVSLRVGALATVFNLAAAAGDTVGLGDSTSVAVVPGAFVDNYTKPTAALTDPVAGTSFTTVNGDLVCSANTDYHDLDVLGQVIGAGGARLFNSRVRMRGTTGNFVASQCVSNSSSANGGFYMERCKIIPDIPKYTLNGYNGSYTTMYRCHIMNCTDGVHLSSGNTNNTFQSCLIDLPCMWDGTGVPTTFQNGTEHASDTRYPGLTHNDSIQLMGGQTSDKFFGCSLQGFWSTSVGSYASLQPWSLGGSANGRFHPLFNGCNNITITPKNGRVTGLRIEYCWIDGGEASFQMPAQGGGFDSGNSVSLGWCRFGANQYPWTTNVYPQVRWSGSIGTFTNVDTCYFDDIPGVPSDLIGQPLVGVPGSYKISK